MKEILIFLGILVVVSSLKDKSWQQGGILWDMLVFLSSKYIV